MLTAAVSSYLLGSLPTAALLGKWLRRIDIRKVGVRNMGALNAYRVLGPFWGLVTFFIDAGKGAVAVALAQANGMGGQAIAVCGLMAVAGHNWPVFARFRGGKGAATGIGVVVAMGGYVVVWVAVIIGALYLLTRNISFALGITFVMLPALYVVEGRPGEAFALGGGLLALVAFRLRSSIGDLMYASQGRLNLIVRYLIHGVPVEKVEARRRLAAQQARATMGSLPGHGGPDAAGADGKDNVAAGV